MNPPKEIDILGVFVSPMAIYLVIAVVVFLAMQPLINRLDVERWIWNRPLAELALFVILTAAVVFVAIGP
ncbi:MAG TPA: DUF1656 domain-containing protein [Gemmatimonadaceae bacterium]|jgi:hypothetical protein|nr:DUF1656 domain-containing protein [Gemmatimonadaceae bacterium]